MNKEQLLFENRDAFRAWLEENEQSTGVWLVFSKGKALKTLTAAQALEEALCFGWIDGVMESINAERYRKYFAPRTAKSRWSEKNRTLARQLEAAGRMTDRGRAKIEEAKRRGTYDTPPRIPATPEQVAALKAALRPYQTALEHFERMTPSVQRTYTDAYFSAKTPAGRERKLARLVERLTLNLNPMESLAKKKAGQGDGR